MVTGAASLASDWLTGPRRVFPGVLAAMTNVNRLIAITLNNNKYLWEHYSDVFIQTQRASTVNGLRMYRLTSVVLAIVL